MLLFFNTTLQQNIIFQFYVYENKSQNQIKPRNQEVRKESEYKRWISNKRKLKREGIAAPK